VEYRTRDAGGNVAPASRFGSCTRPRRRVRVTLAGGMAALTVAGGLAVGVDSPRTTAPEEQLVAAATAPAAPDQRAAPANPVLRLGSAGSEVRKLQKLLRIKRTGIFDDRTRRSVVNYQRSHGIPTTGVVATLTWGALLGSATPAVAATPTGVPPVLSLGMQSDWVRLLQQRLRMPLTTGYFGSLTLSYVQAVQRQARIPVSGVVDRRTWNKAGRIRVGVPPQASVPAAPSSTRASRVLSIASGLRGIPYQINGNSPSTGFNCSSFTQYVFGRIGVDLGGAYTVWQYNKAKKISRAQAKPGDLVFMYNYANNFIGHVGIYAGGDMFWHSPRPGRVVSLDKIYTDKVYFGRVL